MHDLGLENTMYMLRSKNVNYVSAHPLQSILDILQGVGISLCHFVSVYPHIHFNLHLDYVAGYSAVAPCLVLMESM